MAKKYKTSLLDIINQDVVSKMFLGGIADSHLNQLTNEIRDLISSSSESDLKMLWDSYLLSKGEISSFDIKSYPQSSIDLSMSISKLVESYRY